MSSFILFLKGLHSSSCFGFETAADYVYISESNENWEKHSTQRWKDEFSISQLMFGASYSIRTSPKFGGAK